MLFLSVDDNSEEKFTANWIGKYYDKEDKYIRQIK